MNKGFARWSKHLNVHANLVFRLVAYHQHQREFVQCHKMCLPDLQSLRIAGFHLTQLEVRQRKELFLTWQRVNQAVQIKAREGLFSSIKSIDFYWHEVVVRCDLWLITCLVQDKQWCKIFAGNKVTAVRAAHGKTVTNLLCNVGLNNSLGLRIYSVQWSIWIKLYNFTDWCRYRCSSEYTHNHVRGCVSLHYSRRIHGTNANHHKAQGQVGVWKE